MKCPFLRYQKIFRIIDSRPTDDNASIRRRRQCPVCGKRFTTYEKIETLPLIVIKKDNNREPYDRSKIEAGIVRSCHKRSISTAQITAIVDDIGCRFTAGRRNSTMVIGEHHRSLEGSGSCSLCSICLRLP